MMYVNGQAVCPTQTIEKGWDLLADVSPTTESRGLQIPFDNVDLSQYDYFMIVGTIKMSASDWLYLSNGYTAQSGRYFGTERSSYTSVICNENEFPILLFQKVSGTIYSAQLHTTSYYSAIQYDLSSPMYFFCYGGSTTITLDSNFKLYGTKNILNISE